MEQITKPKLTPVLDNLESALKIWWKNLKKIIGIYFWGLLYAFVPLIVILLLVVVTVFLAGSSAVGFFLVFKTIAMIISMTAFAFAVYFSIRAYMGVFLLVKRNYEGDELVIYKETKNLFWSYLFLTILTTVFIVLWSLLLIIPGIIYSIFYSLAVYVFFFEDQKGMKAVRRSISLVKNYWWAVFGRYLFIGLVIWLFGLIISAPMSFVAEETVFYSFWGGVTQVISFLIGPIVLLYTYQIYQDLVKIKKQ